MDGTKKIFTQKEVNKLFDHIPAKTLRWWGIMQLYGWTYEFSDGRGIHRNYELANLYQIGLVEQLAGLNVPIPIIRDTMAQHFCSGLRMSELHKRPLANISTQMDKLLVIKKTFTWGDNSWFDEDSHGIAYIDWVPSLVNKGDVTLYEHTGITIVIKLEAIKEFVDSSISHL